MVSTSSRRAGVRHPRPEAQASKPLHPHTFWLAQALEAGILGAAQVEQGVLRVALAGVTSSTVGVLLKYIYTEEFHPAGLPHGT